MALRRSTLSRASVACDQAGLLRVALHPGFILECYVDAISLISPPRVSQDTGALPRRARRSRTELYSHCPTY
jgi:hypothetical protein